MQQVGWVKFAQVGSDPQSDVVLSITSLALGLDANADPPSRENRLAIRLPPRWWVIANNSFEFHLGSIGQLGFDWKPTRATVCLTHPTNCSNIEFRVVRVFRGSKNVAVADVPRLQGNPRGNSRSEGCQRCQPSRKHYSMSKEIDSKDTVDLMVVFTSDFG